MTNTNFFKGLSALAFFLVASIASAQTVKFTADKVFVNPGETATVTVSVESDVDVKSFSGEIALPEGLSFVETGTDNEYACELGENFADATKTLSGTDGRKAKFLVGGNDPVQDKNVLFTFEVQADGAIAAKGDIEFSNLVAAYQLKKYTADNFKSMFVNNDFVVSPIISDFTILPGETKTVEIAFETEQPMVGFACVIQLPEGLSIDKKSIKTTERTVNHKVIKGDRKNGLYVGLTAQLTAQDNKFIGTEGAVMTFDVTAAEDFGMGGEIVLTEILSNAQENFQAAIVELYSPDVVATVTNGTATGVNGIDANIYGNAEGIYNLNGMRTDRLQKGVNIIKQSGKTIKVIKK